MQSAVQGHAPAMFYLGLKYQEGSGIIKDQFSAFQWFSCAALQKFEPSYLKIAEAYYYGKGVQKNPKQTIHWLQNCATTNQEAQLLLAKCFASGFGVAKSESKSINIYETLIKDYKNLDACVLYGKSLLKHEKKHQEAFLLFESAANLGSIDAMYELAQCYKVLLFFSFVFVLLLLFCFCRKEKELQQI
jgi:TPR repeat protein